MQMKDKRPQDDSCGLFKATQDFCSFSSLVEDRKEQFDAFIAYASFLGYFIAPASHKYHLAFEGGLFLHHVGVTRVLLDLKRLLYPSISDESCVITGLLHDVGKLGTLNRPYYKSGEKGTFIRQDMGADAPVFMSVAVRSLVMVASKINLSTWEAQAILYHDGQYVEDNKSVQLKETPLTLLLHHADMWSAFQIEQKYPIPDEPFTEVGR